MDAISTSKPTFVVNDLVLLEEFCNLKCSYCEGFAPSEFVFKLAGRHLSMPQSWRTILKNDEPLQRALPAEPTVDDFFELGREVLRLIDDRITYPILKLSGGEIFLYDRLTDFIASIHANYAGVQILTNGALMSAEQIRCLAELGNVSFQVSLDGVTLAANVARSRSRGVLNRILRSIEAMRDCRAGVEVNCVLTHHNTAQFVEMAEFFAARGGVTLLPRPVRGAPARLLRAEPAQVDEFRTILDRYDDLAPALPPPAYLERVADLLDDGEREWPCYVPFFVFGANNYGHVHTCTCSDELPQLGSVLDEKTSAFRILAERQQYDPATTPAPCLDCTTQYELFNLIAEGSVTESDLSSVASFQVPGVSEALRVIRGSLPMVST